MMSCDYLNWAVLPELGCFAKKIHFVIPLIQMDSALLAQRHRRNQAVPKASTADSTCSERDE